jgi:ABC-type lipoprotein export system ATPase subunit
MIQLNDVSKTYQVKKGPEVRALDHINLTFGEKGLVFILGKSGSGKSTLLNVIGGLDRIDSGDIVIMGKSSRDFTQAEFDSYRNTYLGFIFQEYNILPDFTIGQNIALALQLQGQKGTDAEVDAILDQVDLHGLRERKPNELSGGQKQRVAIARALIKKPQIIMADEPTGALDSKTGLDIFSTLKKLSKDHLVIVVSHDREFAENFGDRVIELADGKVKSDLTKSYSTIKETTSGLKVLSPRLLSFEKGHVLTPEDIALLNRYLAQAEGETLLSNDEAINTNVKADAKIDPSGVKGSFNETKPEDIGEKNYQPGDFHLKKSRLPFLRSLKIALSSLKSKPFRLIVTSLLVICSLTMFGVSATLANYSPERAFVATYQHFEVTSVELQRQRETSCGENCRSSELLNFSRKGIETIREKSGLPFRAYPSLDDLMGRTSPGSIIMNPVVLSTATFGDNPANSDVSLLYRDALSTYTLFETDEAGLTKEFGLGQVTGNFPSAPDEVLITSYRYESFRRYGYGYEATDGSQVTLTSSDCATTTSFLAKKPLLTYKKQNNQTPASYEMFKIVGVVEMPKAFLKGYSNIDVKPTEATSEQMSSSYSISSFLSNSLVDGLFGMSGFYQGIGEWNGFAFTDDAEVFPGIRSAMNLDEASIKKWYAFLVKNQAFVSNPEGEFYRVEDTYNLPVDRQYYYEGATASFYSASSFVEGGKKTFFWIGFGTACFASLLLATFIASSVSYQRRKIGILRAIGARAATSMASSITKV